MNSLILELDNKNVWHPFTHQVAKRGVRNIVKGEGVHLIDEDGERYIDAISSWWVNLHGHCNPYIANKVSEQLIQLEHCIFSDFTHPQAVTFANRLLAILPENQKKIFYSDNGSTAVEVAIKMTVQYWSNQNLPKTIFIAFENAYHGDTFGSMSIGARNVFNNAFENLLFEVAHIPLPTRQNILEIKNVLAAWFSNHNIAGFIFEPIVQGAAGMLMYEAELLDELISLCNQFNVVTIADEVMTGFGRTGKLFASDYLKNKPDIICLSKGITGGFMPLGATTCNERIYNAYLSNDKTHTFFHGHSYTANATACAAANASLDLLLQKDCELQIEMISAMHTEFAEQIKHHKALKEVRKLGTIIAFEIKSSKVLNYLNEGLLGLSDYFLKHGIILRPLGNVFYIIPPYIITKTELNKIYLTIKNYLDELLN